MCNIINLLNDKNTSDDTLHHSKLYDFMKLGGISKKSLKNIYDSIVRIKNNQKLELASALLDRWLLYNIEGKDVYVKHIASGKLNVLHQIILSGSDWDGAYSFSFKNTQIAAHCEDETLVIEAENTFESVWTTNEAGIEYAIHKTSYKTERDFINEMLQRGYVDEEEVEIYFNPEPWIKDYIAKKLPKIAFKSNKTIKTINTKRKRDRFVEQKIQTQAAV